MDPECVGAGSPRRETLREGKSYRAFAVNHSEQLDQLKDEQHNERRVELRFQQSALANVTVHPNPFNSFLDVTWSAENMVALELLDAAGRVVGTWAVSGTMAHLEVPNIPPGPYRLRATSGQRVDSYPLIRQP